MNVIYIYGASAIGKRTIAQEVAKITGYKLMDNHVHTPLVLNFFSNKEQGYWDLREIIRRGLVKTCATHKVKGLIITGVHSKEDEKEMKKWYGWLKKHASTISFYHLYCGFEERKKRVKTIGRADKLLRNIKDLRPNDKFDKIAFVEHPTIDVTRLSARKAAKVITG